MPLSVGDEVADLLAVDSHFLELVEGLDAGSDCCVEQTLCELYEAGVLGNEVGLAAEGYDGGEVAFVLSEYAAF